MSGSAIGRGAAQFTGLAAVVTGAARGIGAATAERLAWEGADVLAVDISDPMPSDRAATTGERPGRLVALAADVADRAAPEAIVADCLAQFGRLDILVNNAGVGGSNPVDETQDADFDRMVSINLSSVFRISRAALAALPRPGGRIVNVASVFGAVGFPGTSAYAVAKAGVAQLTRQMAADYAPLGILVNAVAPGIIRTPMTERRLAEDPWFREMMVDATPVRRVGTPEDVAGVISFLCSADAGFVAGQVIAVDGGWSTTRYKPRPLKSEGS